MNLSWLITAWKLLDGNKAVIGAAALALTGLTEYLAEPLGNPQWLVITDAVLLWIASTFSSVGVGHKIAKFFDKKIL